MNPANSQQALQQLQQTESSVQDPNAILSGQRQQLGVNAANDTVTGLRGAINNTTKLLGQVAPSVMGRTANSLVTSAQSGRIIQNEQAPIGQQLSDQGTKYTQASEDANKLESEAEQAASGIYQGQKDKLSFLQNIYNSLYQKEQDAQAEQDKQAAITAAKAASGGGGGGFNLSGGGTTPSGSAPTGGTLAGGKSAGDADTAVRSLIDSNDSGTIISTINAITKSAGYGNTYDQAKLQLLEKYMPGWFVTGAPNGQPILNASYINRLGQSKALKNKV